MKLSASSRVGSAVRGGQATADASDDERPLGRDLRLVDDRLQRQ
jgi:hypothetical protein